MNNRVIIFTASTGYGHNQVALAMKNELEAKGLDVFIIEPFKVASKSLDHIVSDGYALLATRLPKAYGKIYYMSNRNILGKPVEIISTKAIEDTLEKIIQDIKPDLIISTHPLMVHAICRLKSKFKYYGPFVSVITDYSPHKAYVSQLVDAYIVGSQYTKLKLIEKGIPERKVFVYGIPIHRSFKEHKNTKLKSDKFTILLMGGSMGLKGIKEVFKRILRLKFPVKLIVICGNNEKLKSALLKKYPLQELDKEVVILGFTNEIADYMEISDVIITKPGGLTVTEAFAKNIPMIIPFFIPGQEEENAEMLVNIGAAVQVDSNRELGNILKDMFENPSILTILKDNMLKVSKEHSLDDAIDLCLQMIRRNREFLKTH